MHLTDRIRTRKETNEAFSYFGTKSLEKNNNRTEQKEHQRPKIQGILERGEKNT